MNRAAGASPDRHDAVPLLAIRELVVRYPGRRTVLRPGRGGHTALRGVSLELGAGEALGLVGESGAGKTSLGRALVGLAPVVAGSICLDGAELVGARPADAVRLRRGIQMVFQDPFSSLDPRLRVGAIVREPLDIRGEEPAAARDQRVADMLRRVGLDADAASRRPRAFSGGQRQRIALARALVSRPRLLVADEPFAALDVSVQAQMAVLLDEIRREMGLSVLFIAHDLPVVRHLCDRVAVLHEGRIVEEGPPDEVFGWPRDPYTRSLVDAVPEMSTGAGENAP